MRGRPHRPAPDTRGNGVRPAVEKLGAALTVRQAAAALAMPERTLRRHLKTGVLKGSQFTRQSPWLIPIAEVERVAALLWVTPDWDAAVAELANDANPANAGRATGTFGD